MVSLIDFLFLLHFPTMSPSISWSVFGMVILHFWIICFNKCAFSVVLWVAFLYSNYILKSSYFGLWVMFPWGYRSSTFFGNTSWGERASSSVCLHGFKEREQLSPRAECQGPHRPTGWSFTFKPVGWSGTERRWSLQAVSTRPGVERRWLQVSKPKDCTADPTSFHQLLFFLRFFFWRLFLQQFYVHNKVERKIQRFPLSRLPPHMQSFPCYQHRSPEWCICYNWWTYTNTS